MAGEGFFMCGLGLKCKDLPVLLGNASAYRLLPGEIIKTHYTLFNDIHVHIFPLSAFMECVCDNVIVP